MWMNEFGKFTKLRWHWTFFSLRSSQQTKSINLVKSSFNYEFTAQICLEQIQILFVVCDHRVDVFSMVYGASMKIMKIPPITFSKFMIIGAIIFSMLSSQHNDYICIRAPGMMMMMMMSSWGISIYGLNAQPSTFEVGVYVAGRQ